MRISSDSTQERGEIEEVLAGAMRCPNFPSVVATLRDAWDIGPHTLELICLTTRDVYHSYAGFPGWMVTFVSVVNVYDESGYSCP